MEIYSIEVKNFKRMHTPAVISCIAITIAAYLLVKNGIILPNAYNKGRRLFWPIFIVTMIISQLFSKKQKTELEKLDTIEDFDLKVLQYQKIYRLRILFYFSIFFIYSALFATTGAYYYFYFNLINLFMVLMAYPNLKLFKLELKNEEAFFV